LPQSRPKAREADRNPGPSDDVVLESFGWEPKMAFLDDARHTGRPLYASQRRVPRQIYTLAVIAASVAIWGIMILTVLYRY
jgi:hypothetical protein